MAALSFSIDPFLRLQGLSRFPLTRTLPAPATVFSRLGLRSDSLIRRSGVQTDVVAVRLRHAFEELGGVFLAYGVYLQWRSDVLTSGEIEALGSLQVDVPGVSREAVIQLLTSELPGTGAALAAGLSEKPVWKTLNRTAYASKVQDQNLIVQVAHVPVTEAAVAEFRQGLAALGLPQLVALQAPALIDEFVEWLRTSESLEDERAYLDAISQYGGDTGAVYPVAMPLMCTPKLLVWAPVEGAPVESLVAKGDPAVCGLIARAIFEQFCALGMVECDLRLDGMVMTPQGKLGFRRVSRPAATPPGLSSAALEYIAAAISRDAALSSRALLRLAISYESPLLEKQLISQLSAVDPELKVHRWFPQSAETFEANWRAISRLGVDRRLYVDCLHRNLVATGYWIGDTVRLGAPAKDLIAEAQWPVVGRILQSRVTSLLNPDEAMQWAASSGLLMLGVMKESSRLAGEIRDNRLSMGFDITTARTRTESTRPAWLLPLGALMLGVLLVCLRWGALAPAAMIIPVRVLTIAAFAGLFWVVLRIR